MSSNYGFEPTLDGLNNIDSDSTTTNNIICDTIQINVSGTSQTPPLISNDTSIATTAYVNSVISSIGSGYVSLTGNQTLTTGIKTFTNLPQCSATPINSNDLVTKAYADSGSFVNLTTAQSVGGDKTFTSNIIAGAGIIPVSGTNLTLTTTGGEDVTINGSNDITFNSSFNTVFNAGAYGSFQAGIGYTFVSNGGYGFNFIDNYSAGGSGINLNAYSNNIANASVLNYDYNTASIFSPAYAQPNRGAIYNNTAYNVPSTTGITFTNGGTEDVGVIGTGMTVSVPAGNTTKVIRVAIPFDLFTYNYTNPSLSGAGNFSLSYTGFGGLSILKNGGAYTPAVLLGASAVTGTTTRTWTRTGTQTSIDGIASYMTTIYVTFSIDTANTSTDNYQVRLSINGTINWGGWFGSTLFVFYKTGTLVGNSYTSSSYAVYTGGTMTNPTITGYIDASITAVGNTYPVPASTNSFYFPLNNNITPPGMITMFGGATPPPGWLLCSGALVNVVDYLNLFFVIGNLYGGTSTLVGTVLGGTFGLPNTKGIFVSGAGSQTIGVSNTYTRTLGFKQGHNLENHQHCYSDSHYYDEATSGQPNGSTADGCLSGAAYQTSSGDGTGMNADESMQNRLTKGTYLSTATQVNQATAPTTGSLTGTETYPANICFNYIIKW